jgi:hypothetical protein
VALEEGVSIFEVTTSRKLWSSVLTALDSVETIDCSQQ